MKVNTKHLALLSTLLIIFGSITPLPYTPGGEETKTITLSFLHLISYLICGFLWARSLESKRAFVMIMLVLIPLTEILQIPLPYRDVSIHDLITNMIGATIGYLISEQAS